MTSAINTGSIDSNYPTPGVNNNSQGFRTNFGSIKTNLNTAASEITDLQNKGIFKSALTGTTLDNNMANALITNATTKNFSQIAYNLGSSLNGDIPTIDKANGDYQYGIVTGNINTLSFTNWGPSGNYSAVTVSFTLPSNIGLTIGVPSIISGASLTTIEGYDPVNNWIRIPANVTQVTYLFWTTDCGTTVQIVPLDRPRQVTQVFSRSLDVANSASTQGLSGDVPGDIAYSNISNTLWFCNAVYNGNSGIWNPVGTGGGGGTPSSLVNGNSNVVVDSSGNIRFSAIGTANTLIVGNTGITTGNITLTGRITSVAATLGNVGNVKIFGGLNGQALVTDGTGNLTWSNVSSGGGGGGGGSVAGADQQVQYNNAGVLSASPNFKWDNANSLLTATHANLGTSNVNGTLTMTNATVTGLLSLSGVTVSGNFNVTNDITSNGNIYANSGTIYANSIQTVGTGAVTIASSSTISLTPNGGNAGANANVIFGANAGLIVGGKTYLGGDLYLGRTSANNNPTPANIFLSSVLSSPQGTIGTQGQTVLQIASDGTTKIWVSLGGTLWKSASLT